MISIQAFTFNPFSENTYVVFDETNEGVIIDPGCYSKEEQKSLTTFVENNRLKIKYILLTHGHIDHVLGNDFVKDFYKVPLLIGKKDEATLRSVKTYAPVYGFDNYREAEPDQFLEEGDTVKFGASAFKILFLPGHAPGHIGFYSEPDKLIFSGDVLFEGSIGRTDLPGGNFEMLIQSIQQKLFALPDEVIIYAGHGNPTSIGEEKITNPFCALSLLK